MITLSRDGRPAGNHSSWFVLVATAVTCGAFAGLLLAMRHMASLSVLDAQRTHDFAVETIAFVTPSIAPAAPAQSSRVSSRTTAPELIAPPDSGPTPLAPTSEQRTPRETESSSNRMPSRLVPPRAQTGAWFSQPAAHDPFTPAAPPSPESVDSTLAAMASLIAQLAATRVPTTSERDAAAKEAMLKIRLSGRALLVPPDNTGGLITSRLPLPFLSSGPSKVARAREARDFQENRARLERLRQRADSLRRMRREFGLDSSKRYP